MTRTTLGFLTSFGSFTSFASLAPIPLPTLPTGAGTGGTGAGFGASAVEGGPAGLEICWSLQRLQRLWADGLHFNDFQCLYR